jgi:hypothetical protein
VQPQDTAYPRFKSRLTPSELERFYTPTEDELAFCVTAARSPTTRMGFVILLKTFQRLGYFVLSSQVPEPIIKHIAQSMPHSQLKCNKKVGHYAACKCVKNTSFGER